MARLRMAGIYRQPNPSATTFGHRTVAELGPRRIAVFQARPDGILRADLVDPEDPTKVIATADVDFPVEWAVQHPDEVPVRQVVPLGAGRALVFFGHGYIYLHPRDLGGENTYFVVLTYRDGQLSFGPPVKGSTNGARMVNAYAMFTYALSGSKVRLLAEEHTGGGFENNIRDCRDIFIDGDGVITFSTWRPHSVPMTDVNDETIYNRLAMLCRNDSLYVLTFDVDNGLTPWAIQRYDAETLELKARKEFPSGAEPNRFMNFTSSGTLQVLEMKYWEDS